MQKNVKYLIIFMAIVYLVANRQVVIALYERVALLFENVNGEEYIAMEKRAQQIEDALGKKDAAALKALFSEYVVRSNRNLDGDIEKLFALDGWEITGRKGKLQNVVEINDAFMAERFILAKYTFDTYTGKFVIFFIDQTECSSVKSKIGLSFLQCAWANDKEVEFYDNMSKMGVLVSLK